MNSIKTRPAFTVYRLPFTMRYPFTVICDQWSRANGKGTANGEWLTANGFTEVKRES